MGTLTWRLVLCVLLIETVLGQVREQPVVTFERPALVHLGDAAILKCILSEDYAITDGNECKFTRPDGEILVVNFMTGGAVTNSGTGASEPGYTGFKDESKLVCGMTVEAMNEAKDIGQWSCLMDENSETFWHKGSFNLLTPELSHVADVRLPRHLSPFLYTVSLTPYFEGDDATTSGSMQFIMVHNNDHPDATTYPKQFYMHAKNIAIHENDLIIKTFSEDHTPAGFEYDLEREFFIIHLKDLIWPGQDTSYHLLNVTFSSLLNDDMRGFYKSSYVNDEGETKNLATTQFQYIDARRAFPCMDEPDMKSRYQIQLGRKEEMVATSNMDIIETFPIPGQPGYVYDKFRFSVKMSPYLLAFLVSDFVNTPTVDPFFNIIHAPGKQDQAKLAADAGPDILYYFEHYFGIEYALPKLDMVAIPDFKYGAMENWGLITYRESSILYSEEISSQSDRDRVIEVIAHELAHMWFGNLVTMEWWTDLWLNEGKKQHNRFFKKQKITLFHNPNWFFQDLQPTLKTLEKTIMILNWNQGTELFSLIYMMFLVLMP